MGDIMIVYNHKNNKKINQLILNTDCCYYKNIFENQKLPTFFLNLPLPQDCQSLLGLYVHFEIPKLEVYQHNDLFKKHTVFLTKQLKHYFHFENTHLIHLDMNNFFIVMFNINNHDMIYHTKYFIKNSQKNYQIQRTTLSFTS